jgi:hypothetical protein
MGHASARLYCAFHCCSLFFAGFLWRKIQVACTLTPTLRRFLHGAMLGMWRKKPIPHRNRRRKTMHLPPSSAVLWHPQNRPTHIKRENKRQSPNWDAELKTLLDTAANMWLGAGVAEWLSRQPRDLKYGLPD